MSGKAYSFQRGSVIGGGLSEEIMKRLDVIWLKKKEVNKLSSEGL